MIYQLVFIGALKVEKKLTSNKRTKRNYHVRSYLSDILDFAEHQDNFIYGLGSILTL